MSRSTLIISRNYLLAKGLLSIIEQDYPGVGVTLTDRLEYSNDNCEILMIEYDMLPDPAPYTLERLRSHYNSPKTILCLENNPPENIQAYLDGWINYNNNERDVRELLNKLYEEGQSANGSGSFANTVLSEREAEVLRFVALGFTNKAISEELCISTHTVITHRKNITSKLGIKTIAGLAVYAVINGMITAEEMNAK